MVFVNRLAEHAEMVDHHPDLDIRYNRLLITLTSHDAGGITQRDLRMAKSILGMESKGSGK
jgi:4a-hydroxytetrahydrobiopterin dehydratase